VNQVVREDHCDPNRRACQDDSSRADAIGISLNPSETKLPVNKKKGQHQQGADRSDISRRAELHRVHAANKPDKAQNACEKAVDVGKVNCIH